MEESPKFEQGWRGLTQRLAAIFFERHRWVDWIVIILLLGNLATPGCDERCDERYEWTKNETFRVAWCAGDMLNWTKLEDYYGTKREGNNRTG